MANPQPTTPRLSSPGPSVNERATSTQRTFTRFQEDYNIPLSQNVFIGLCAYLSALLTWGFEASPVDLDRFIVCYSIFESCLPQLYTQSAHAEKASLPAYHQWLNDASSALIRAQAFNSDTAEGRGLILSEQTLREIWRENPFAFLHAEMSLQRIAADAIRNEPEGGEESEVVDT
ncbi:hypothetical protein ABEF95_003937 [Exophiala dermatitidis]